VLRWLIPATVPEPSRLRSGVGLAMQADCRLRASARLPGAHRRSL
jgi:hypothetical protein